MEGLHLTLDLLFKVKGRSPFTKLYISLLVAPSLLLHFSVSSLRICCIELKTYQVSFATLLYKYGSWNLTKLSLIRGVFVYGFTVYETQVEHNIYYLNIL